METSTNSSLPEPEQGYYSQRWEERVQHQAREECARLVEHRLDEILEAARSGTAELQRALQRLISEVRRGVVSGSHRARLPLLRAHDDTTLTANGAGHQSEEEGS